MDDDWERLIEGRQKEDKLAESKGNKWSKRVFIITALLLLLSAAIVCWWMYEHRWERNWKISRTEALSATLPEGTLRLRTLLTPPGAQSDLTPFIAYSQSPGRLHVLTNATRPHWSQPYSAWFIEDPRIQDVVMLTEDFFCARNSCFYIDINNAITSNETAYHNVTLNMVEVPLPKRGANVFLTEPCYSLNYRPCSIVLEFEQQGTGYGQVVMNTYNQPTIEIMKNGIISSSPFKAFHTSSEPKREAWYGLNHLVVYSTDREIDETVITHVEKEDSVEILALSDELQIVTVMNEVRIFTLKPHCKAITRDEIVINNRAAAITALVHENTFEICHLSTTHIECYAKLIKE